jgi:nicotinamidase-related amidase
VAWVIGLPLPLTERTVHLCVDMQRIFSAEGPWATPWMDKVLPVAAALANRHPERTIFTRFIPPEAPGSATTRAGVSRPASASISSCRT